MSPLIKNVKYKNCVLRCAKCWIVSSSPPSSELIFGRLLWTSSLINTPCSCCTQAWIWGENQMIIDPVNWLIYKQFLFCREARRLLIFFYFLRGGGVIKLQIKSVPYKSQNLIWTRSVKEMKRPSEKVFIRLRWQRLTVVGDRCRMWPFTRELARRRE